MVGYCGLATCQREDNHDLSAHINHDTLKPLQMRRPSWDEYFMGVARAISTRSSCSRASVGCVIVDDAHRIVATGYNGAPAGERHCDHTPFGPGREPDQTDMRWDDKAQRWTCAFAVHAEKNALDHMNGRKFYVDVTLYTIHSPCIECAELIAAEWRMGWIRVKRIVYNSAYNLTPEISKALEGIELVAFS